MCLQEHRQKEIKYKKVGLINWNFGTPYKYNTAQEF